MPKQTLEINLNFAYDLDWSELCSNCEYCESHPTYFGCKIEGQVKSILIPGILEDIELHYCTQMKRRKSNE